MEPVHVTQTDAATGDVSEWNVPSPEAFVAHVCQLAFATPSQPFAVARHWTAIEAIAAGVPDHADKTGAIVTVASGSPAFVHAKPGQLVLPGSGTVLDDSTTTRIRACVYWLEESLDCSVTLSGLDQAVDLRALPATHPAIAAARKAVDAQAAALEAAVEAAAAADGTCPPEALAMLASACAARKRAEDRLPSIQELAAIATSPRRARVAQPEGEPDE